jgi:hypothetical protein
MKVISDFFKEVTEICPIVLDRNLKMQVQVVSATLNKLKFYPIEFGLEICNPKKLYNEST